ncbi:MAG: hypothetical protein ACP5GL_08010 [Infirmifilum sp.]
MTYVAVLTDESIHPQYEKAIEKTKEYDMPISLCKPKEYLKRIFHRWEARVVDLDCHP